MGGHAGDGQPLGRAHALVEVAALAPVRIGEDRLPADLVEGDVLRRMFRRGGDRHGGEDAVGKARRPLQHLHAAHGAADDAEQGLDAERVDQHGLRPHHVADGDERQVEPIGAPGGRIERGRPGAAHAAADDVRADDEIMIGVDRLAGPDHRLPPAGFAGDRMDVGDVLVARQRVADEDGIAARGVQRPVGLIGDGERRERAAGVETERPVEGEARDKALRRLDLALRSRRGLDPRAFDQHGAIRFDMFGLPNIASGR